VTELIFQAVAREQRVLVCAPSNIAVDNILEKIIAQLETLTSTSSSSGPVGKHDGTKKMKASNSKISSAISSNDDIDGNNSSIIASSNLSSAQILPRVLRLGHRARISESILQHCLDSQILADEV